VFFFCENGLINRRRKKQGMHYHPYIKQENPLGTGLPAGRQPFGYGHNSIAYIGT
jgi:hypothetical protein